LNYFLYCSFNERYYVQYMNDNQDKFNILRLIIKKPRVTQRELSSELGMSLGKINFCLKELKKKGLIKISNFKKSKNKLNYIYLLTPKGISQKTELTLNFMQRKMQEYEELRKEYEDQKK